jgi:hypothetical protein
MAEEAREEPVEEPQEINRNFGVNVERGVESMAVGG